MNKKIKKIKEKLKNTEVFNRIKNTKFIKSFKEINKKTIYVVLCDILFYFVSFVLFLLTILILKIQSSIILKTMPDLSNLQALQTSLEAQEQAILQLGGLKYLFLYWVITILIAFFILILIVSFFKGIIWSNISKEKFDFKFYMRFSLLNLIYYFGLILILILTFAAMKPAFAGIFWLIEFLLFTYLTNISYGIFDKEVKIRKNIKKATIIGFQKFYRFLLPLLNFFWVIIFVLIVIGIVSKILPERFLMLLSILFLFIYLAWARIYFALIVKSIEKKIKNV